MALNKDQERAIRIATQPLVEDIVTALTNAGMTREKALKTIRWATYRLGSQKETEE